METDFATVEKLARQIAKESGCNYDAPRAKKNYWRRKARSVVVFQERQPTDLVTRCLRSFGWRV